MNRVLLVEDEPNLGNTLSETLSNEGFEICWAKTALEAIQNIQSTQYDLAILDVGLPDINGFELAEQLKYKTQSRLPFLFLTAFSSSQDRIHGLELGADDYVCKPFHLKELLLRVRAILKRRTLGSVQIGKAQINFEGHYAVVNEEKISLSQKECALLDLFVSNRGKVVSRDTILNEVWSQTEFPTPRTVDNFIVRLRKLVEENPDNPQFIRSVRGIGYQLL
ncbi:MAG: response regulator transcription factor [Bacteriovoracia bacterium]